MSTPKFFVVARVVGRDGALPLWKDRLFALCGVSATEPLGDSYYWGQDLDGEPDTLWGLEGYTHPIGFFLGHVSTDIFKDEMAKVDADALLRHEQGLASPDYDLHHYDWAGGWLKRDNDPDRDSTTSNVVVYHFWVKDSSQRGEVLNELRGFAAGQKGLPDGLLQSCGLLEECRDDKMLTMWLRTTSADGMERLFSSSSFLSLLAKIKPMIGKEEIHRSKAFNGHLDIKPNP
ncbi:hypothetical protein N7494_006813 [Penicillium frequentans]|uniref:ABM domain-containing protein n=1 Tax=Penicillium frequentans TaxID=3151616 RepID=A0AAD6CX41_9EURO|nr:hypothetical protein N7494_006813 [Penicillium glabrum]